ncbi:hypothetical protein RSA37_11735 [Mammaliicoccus sciuri]|uniref:hypothetical protein n=1 Tax=Mammaliicoccus sciuri TaxID=1296 RepID=UPI0007342FF3|nr:hypothetical protein [Mammaliicoccus sciuri]KTT82702.1 hypothetical protein NS1R_11995 [Mammaliicoccus sciuri]KTT88241.1 hypothetical protein NS112_09495 [Mammaliicoccus sciuri]KTT89784.1 hypothetical protein NS36R_08020 [Mammaliicoccus sciuri]KTT94176.1 hypothetical protein NS44R_08435 [Mammaliicoccus sciuri]KTW10718.1 hypothetical protein RSA37_11735 [Mammaliicoccus sciuri]
MPTIKYTREDIDKLVNELDQYRTAHDKLTAGLKEAVAESIKYKRERDSLIKDVEKLRGEKENLKCLGYETYKDAVKYKTLTEHIKDKALNNPSEHRYFRLVHFIDDLEADTHD